MKAKYILLIVSLSALFACETTEKIEDFPLRPSKMVVNCFFSQDSTWNFQVSNSLSVLDNAELKYIDNATIKLYKEDVLVDTITKQAFDGWYRSEESLPEHDASYSIKVSSPDYEQVLIAEDFVPQDVQITNVSLSITDSVFHDWEFHSGGNVEGYFNISFNDPADYENYYQLSVFYIDTIYNYEDSVDYFVNKRTIYFSNNDATAEDNAGRNKNLMLSDILFDGQSYQIKAEFSDWDARRGKQYFIELLSLNRSGYMYRKSIVDYEDAHGDPFAEPVQIYSNIENGYGIFAGYSINTYGVTME